MISKTVSLLGVLLFLVSCTPAMRDDLLLDESGASHTIELYRPLEDIKREALLNAYREFIDLPLQAEDNYAAMRRLADIQFELDMGVAEQTNHQNDISQRAIAIYLDLLATYPADSRNDQILYILAAWYDHSDQIEQTLEVLGRLITQHPESSYIIEAHFRRAEILFNQSDYAAAASSYQHVISTDQTSSFYAHGLYKYGWALFKAGNYHAALEAFFNLLDNKFGSANGIKLDAPMETLSPEERKLVEDSLRVLSICFSYLQDDISIGQYIRQRGQRQYAYMIYESLAQLYHNKKRFTDSAEIYKSFVKNNPYHPRSPYFQIKVISIYEAAGFATLTWEAKQEFINHFRISSAYWRKQNVYVYDYPKVIEHLKQAMLEAIKFYHAKANKSGRQQDYEVAIKEYREYLKFFPDDPGTSPQIHFLLGELFFESGQYEAAIKEYEVTAYSYPQNEQADKAGYAALIAYEKYISQLSGERKLEWSKKALESSMQFSTYFYKHPKIPSILLNVLVILNEQKDFERAISVAERLLQRSDLLDNEEFRTAWQIKANIHYLRNEYRLAQAAFHQAMQLTAAGTDEMLIMKERLATVVYKQGEYARDKGDIDTAIRQFLAIGDVYKGSTIHAIAEYDAANLLLDAERWQQSIEVLERFRRTFPQHEWHNQVELKLAKAYLSIGSTIKAATTYERIGMIWPDPEFRKESLIKAAELYELANEKNKVLNVYQELLVRQYLDFDDSLLVQHKIANIYKENRNDIQYHAWLKKIIQSDSQAGNKRSQLSRELAAQASLVLLEPLYDNYKKMALVEPLQQNLKLKKQALEKLLSEYAKASEYGDAEVTTAATYRIGELYYDFSEALLTSERPGELTEEELDQYDVLLEEQAYPFEEQAIEIFEVNYKRIRDGVYNQWTRTSLSELAKLLPVQYGKVEKSEQVFDKIN